MDKWLSFKARIDKVDINPCVDVPIAVSKTFGLTGYIPVELRLKGTGYLANLVPLGKGEYRLYLNGPMLRSSGWKVGDEAVIDLRYDPKPRIEPVPPTLLQALIKHPKAQKTFEGLTASRRKEISRYINNLKSQEAIDRNVKKVVKALEGSGLHIAVNGRSTDNKPGST